MKKAFNICKRILFLTLVACFFLFNTGCGLDTFYVIEPPIHVFKSPEYTTNEYSDRVFQFETNETTDIEGFTIQGTEVYYRIYADSSTMNSEVSNLITISNDDEKSSGAPDRLKDTYKYKPLKIANLNINILIPFQNKNQMVKIRLTDYQNISDYSSRVLIDDVLKGKPVRNLNGKPFTFNFGRKGEYDKIPLAGDEDFNEKNSNGDGKYYVAMFAMAIGHDNTYTNYYSNILYLGTVTIDSGNFDN